MTMAKAAVAVLLVSMLCGLHAQQCPGVCQDNSNACPGSYESGLCPGGSNIQCCQEATPGCSGQCQDNSLPCNGNYGSGTCPGSDNIGCCVPNAGSGLLGLDSSVPVSAASAQCFIQNNYNFTVVRAWHNTGTYDPNAPASLANLANLGVLGDVYMFPCSRTDAATQVNSMVAKLQAAGATWGRVWLDIEMNPSSACAWTSSGSSNCNFVRNLIAAVRAAGFPTGVYTSSVNWNQYMGGSACQIADSNLPLWYAHYDNKPACSDFKPFGGWTSALWKQYKGDATVCGLDLDVNIAC